MVHRGTIEGVPNGSKDSPALEFTLISSYKAKFTNKNNFNNKC